MKRNLRTTAIIIFFVLFILYGAFEALKVFLGPSLVITSPRNMDTVDYPLLTVSGVAKRVAYISIDSRQIFTDTSGNFTDKLLLLPGYNIIKVEAKDRFGREIKELISIWYESEISN